MSVTQGSRPMGLRPSQDLLAILAATAVSLGAGSATAAPGLPVTPPEEFVIRPAQTPKVVATYPVEGQTVAGGTVVLKIVFDQPMRAGDWAYGPGPGGRFPECLDKPRMLSDQRTFVLLCSAPLNTAFALSVNGAPDFTGVGGRPATPYLLRFSTSNDVSRGLLSSLRDAGLSEADDPIMDSAAAKGDAVLAKVPVPASSP